ncbi:MAG: SpoIID/LytB domain-containing protein [Bacteroidota bacterium]
MQSPNIIILAFLSLFINRQTNFGPHKTDTAIRVPDAKIIAPKKYLSDEIVNIKIFSQIKTQAFTFSPDEGTYIVWGNGVEVANTSKFPIIKLSYVNDSIEIKTFENVIGRFKKIKISSADPLKTFRLKLISPDRKPRFYQDNLIVDVEAGSLKCINEITLDNYISGVVQAESGRRSYQEFYKVQAILARTFALSHLQKHALEGFSLCDHTHCQAYFGKTTELEIMKAVTETKGKVVVDDNLNLIEAAFHSNSGGQTVNSEDVWGSKLAYLRSVNDTFSTKMPNAKWERKMAKEDWLTYLKLKHNYPVQDSNARWLAINFKQDSRKPYLEANNVKVPLKNVRTDLQLKSTFFSIVPQGDTLVFKGRGFGHGVGMCQEGAMRMAKLGYKYPDVINFYYQKTQLIDLHKLNFFKEE